MDEQLSVATYKSDEKSSVLSTLRSAVLATPLSVALVLVGVWRSAVWATPLSVALVLVGVWIGVAATSHSANERIKEALAEQPAGMVEAIPHTPAHEVPASRSDN